MKTLILLASETEIEFSIALALAVFILATILLTAALIKEKHKKRQKEQKPKDNQEQRFKIQIRVQPKELITIIQNVQTELTKKGYPCHIERNENTFSFGTGNNDNLTQKTFNEIIQNQGYFEIRMMNLYEEDSFKKAVKREIIQELINFIQNEQETQQDPLQEQRAYKQLAPRKCTCCGAQFKPGSNVCEYCKTSYIEL